MANLVPGGGAIGPQTGTTSNSSLYAIHAPSGKYLVVNGPQYANTPGSFYLGNSIASVKQTLSSNAVGGSGFPALSETDIGTLLNDLPEPGHYTEINPAGGGIIAVNDVVNALLIGTGTAGEAGIFDSIPGIFGEGGDAVGDITGDVEGGTGDTTGKTGTDTTGKSGDDTTGKSDDTSGSDGSDGSSANKAAVEVAASGLAGSLGLSGLAELAIRILEGMVGAALLFLGLSALTGTGPSGNPVSLVKSVGKGAATTAAVA